MTTASASTPYFVPRETGRWSALALAAAVHAALFAFLWFGVRWQNETPTALEAEVWSMDAQEAAPKPQPVPEPIVKEIVKPVEPPVVKPDIALEQDKKRKLQEQRDEEKLDAEKLKKEEADKKRKQDLKDKALRDKARAEDLKRMLTQAGTGGTGTAPKTQGARGNADYISRVAAKIKSNTVFNVPSNLVGDPYVEYVVELLPDGSIRRPIRKTTSSGVPGFDDAVLNAIEKSQPYPPDKSGRVPSSITLIHKPKDQ